MSARPAKCGARPSSLLRRSTTLRALASRAECVVAALESLVTLRRTSKATPEALASRAECAVAALESLVTLRRTSKATPGALATWLRMRELLAYPRAISVTAAKRCATSANSD